MHTAVNMETITNMAGGRQHKHRLTCCNGREDKLYRGKLSVCVSVCELVCVYVCVYVCVCVCVCWVNEALQHT